MDEEGQRKKSLIYLTGFMGSGKSTIGPILANTLGFDFLDIDRAVEEKAAKKIVEIFASDGERAFRSLERTTLEEAAARDHCVISLGGGTIANEENFQLIRESGIVVYLQLPPEEILQRVRHKTDRPLLRDATGEELPAYDLHARIDELLNRREEFYSRADIVVRTDRKKVGATVDEIVRRLRGVLKI